jgi:hypothetical protein
MPRIPPPHVNAIAGMSSDLRCEIYAIVGDTKEFGARSQGSLYPASLNK